MTEKKKDVRDMCSNEIARLILGRVRKMVYKDTLTPPETHLVAAMLSAYREILYGDPINLPVLHDFQFARWEQAYYLSDSFVEECQNTPESQC